MPRCYVLITITAADANQQKQVEQAMAELGLLTDANPACISHSRQRNDGLAWIIEANWPTVPTKTTADTAMASKMKTPLSAFSTTTTYTAFSPDKGREASRQDAMAYLAANAKDWGES